MREVPFGNDGSYSHEAIIARINADLANDLGNLAQRSLSMIAKNCGGRVPVAGALTVDDKAILDAAYAILPVARVHMESQQIHKCLEVIWQVVGDANKYFAGQEPWALKKTDPERMGSVLYTTTEVIRIVALLAQCVMPQSAAKLLDLLAVNEAVRSFAQANADHALQSGTELPVPRPSGVFPRYVETEQAC